MITARIASSTGIANVAFNPCLSSEALLIPNFPFHELFIQQVAGNSQSWLNADLFSVLTTPNKYFTAAIASSILTVEAYFEQCVIIRFDSNQSTQAALFYVNSRVVAFGCSGNCNEDGKGHYLSAYIVSSAALCGVAHSSLLYKVACWNHNERKRILMRSPRMLWCHTNLPRLKGFVEASLVRMPTTPQAVKQLMSEAIGGQDIMNNRDSSDAEDEDIAIVAFDTHLNALKSLEVMVAFNLEVYLIE